MKINTDYVLPGANQLTLSQKLADEIVSHFHADRNNRFQLFVLAAGLRKLHLNKVGGRETYSEAFTSWFNKQHLNQHFGSLANFTKYASAGDVVVHVAKNTSDSEKYLSALPVSMTALYEISQVLKQKKTGKNGLSGKELVDLCFQFTAKRANIDDPKHEWKTTKPPLIRKNTTAAVVRNWLRVWNDPPPPKQRRTDKRTLPFVTITVSGELFDFDKKTGDKIGCVDLPEVEAFFSNLQKLFTDDNALQFKLAHNLDYLTEGYFKRKDASDPASKILNAKSKTRLAKAAKKSA